jgi:Phage terminase large subunit (GpA)
MQPSPESPPRQRSNPAKPARRVPSGTGHEFPPALRRVMAATLRAFAPPPTLTVSQWADREWILSPEASAEPGHWDTARAEYLRGVMDALSDPTVTRVVVAKGSQVGYTECLGERYRRPAPEHVNRRDPASNPAPERVNDFETVLFVI